MLVVEYPNSVTTFERVNGGWSFEVRHVRVGFHVAEKSAKQAHFYCGVSEKSWVGLNRDRQRFQFCS